GRRTWALVTTSARAALPTPSRLKILLGRGGCRYVRGARPDCRAMHGGWNLGNDRSHPACTPAWRPVAGRARGSRRRPPQRRQPLGSPAPEAPEHRPPACRRGGDAGALRMAGHRQGADAAGRRRRSSGPAAARSRPRRHRPERARAAARVPRRLALLARGDAGTGAATGDAGRALPTPGDAARARARAGRVAGGAAGAAVTPPLSAAAT